MLIDQDRKKKDLEVKAWLGHYTVNKVVHGGNGTIDVLIWSLKSLGCSLDDIMRFVPEWSNCF